MDSHRNERNIGNKDKMYKEYFHNRAQYEENLTLR